jgi:2-polyprenyl-6-methoxyphenol hydroxylase-like FAD-dependent oxidoreductase
VSERPSVLIVGGGIGGLALALALRSHDIETNIWERAPELREVGAGLLLTSNARTVLDRLGISSAANASGQLIHSWQILDRAGHPLQTFASEREEPLSLSISRAAFQEILRRPLSLGVLHLGREVSAVEPSLDETKITARTLEGNSLSADLIIGADGGRSRVRELIFGHAALRECGYVGWRALVNHVPVDWGNGRITETWGEGCRFGIAPISKTRSYWYATENVSPGWTLPQEQRKAHLLSKFRRWHRPICDLIEATPEENVLLNSISDHPALPQWSRGRVGLLGDAAHLMTPNLGQGAAMALEDAWVMAACLRRYGASEEALRHYERRRRWRAAYVVWQSRQVGRMIQLEHPWIVGLRDAALSFTPDALGTLLLAPVFSFRA